MCEFKNKMDLSWQQIQKKKKEQLTQYLEMGSQTESDES